MQQGRLQRKLSRKDPTDKITDPCGSELKLDKQKDNLPIGFMQPKHKGKGKAVPLQAWSGPEVSRKLRFPDFIKMTQDGGKFVSLTHRPPLTKEIHLVPKGHGATALKNSNDPIGNRTRDLPICSVMA